MPLSGPKKILLVDDEHDILDPLASFLRRQGYAVLAVDNGTEALRVAKNELPDLIVLDLMLPDLDGSEIAAELLNTPVTHEIPIIFLTGILTQADQNRLGQVVANRQILAKPCKPAELLALIKAKIGLAT